MNEPNNARRAARFDLRRLPMLAATLLWGVVELVALARSRWSHGQRG